MVVPRPRGHVPRRTGRSIISGLSPSAVTYVSLTLTASCLDLSLSFFFASLIGLTRTKADLVPSQVYCRLCFDNRRAVLKKDNKDDSVRFQASCKLIRCAVEGCTSDVTNKRNWVGIFLRLATSEKK